ncbi:Spy/CpxP family protein refolding chaperone [Povalibacter uvarum]|uniref:Spy/CpxP family protein refolding chaperone n=1 Tax=Povalibacter uvarum TaxID=732238 RepID=A0A841HTG5_9GAMM|nr:Spy/CpxP family protein refolding chaperone [Povalibacter uvarum]MBB6095298.1 Spy/CpxP family protein refolding chaperone [Povalibacter uvarum]
MTNRFRNSPLRNSLLAGCAALTIAGGIAYAGTSADSNGDQRPQSMHRDSMHRHRGHDAMPMMGALKQLDLTAQQQQSVRAVLDSNAQQRKALRERERSNRDSLAGTMPDDPNYPGLIATKKQLAAEAIQQASDTQTQVFALLTPEQKAKVPQVLAERKARWEQRRGEHKERDRAAPTTL